MRATQDQSPTPRGRRRPKAGAAALAVLAALAVVAAACSSGTSTSSSTTTTSTGSTSTTSTTSSTPTPASLLPTSIRTSGTITNCSPENNPPLIFLDTNQNLTGIDYDLATALEKQLKVKFNWISTKFPAIIPGLQSGKCTTSLSIVSDTPARETTISFVDYIVDGVTFIGPYGNPTHITTPADFCGKSLGATQGAIEAKFISDLSTKYCTSQGKPAITPSLYGTAATVLLALDSGRVSADVHPGAASEYIAKTTGGKKYQILMPGNLYLADYEGIGIAKGQTQLANALVAALRALEADGTYASILKKYGLTRMALTPQQLTVNAATTQPLTAAQKKIYVGTSPYITAT